MQNAVKKGFIPNISHTEYKKPVTVADACALAVAFYESVVEVKITGYPKITKQKNDEVDKALCKQLLPTGLLNKNGALNVSAAASREVMAFILIRTAEEIFVTVENDAKIPVLADAKDVSPWAMLHVELALVNGFMELENKKFLPKNTATMEDAIVFFIGCRGQLPCKTVIPTRKLYSGGPCA
jgi:hypothetical protein